MKKILLLSILSGILFTNFAFAENYMNQTRIPENVDEGKNFISRIFDEFIKRFPEIARKTWEEEILPLWKKMYEIAVNFWKNHLESAFFDLWNKIKSIASKEIQERKPQIKEDFEQEKKELKEEAPAVGKSVWQRLKDLVK